MIEIIAIDNQTAAADLLRLAANFFESRLFTQKQKKQMHMVVEMSDGMPPRPISREQLAKKPGAFKSTKYQFDCAVNVAQGFEIALSQFSHELIHASQIINNRYDIALKSTKKDGVKQKLYHAKWIGKKCGIIDDMIWESRPWESEAVLASQQLSAEFFALINGQQSHFPAQGQKKELKLLDLQLSMPPIPQATPTAPVVAPAAAPMSTPMAAPEAAMPPMGQPANMQADMPAMYPESQPRATADMAHPTSANPDVANPNGAVPAMPADPLLADSLAMDGQTDNASMDDDELAALIAAPEAAFFGDAPAVSDMPSSDDLDLIAELSDSNDGLASQPQPAIMGQADKTAMPEIMGQPDMTAPDRTAPDMTAMPASLDKMMGDREVYVQGIDEPRSLKQASLQAKKDELAAKGLLK